MERPVRVAAGLPGAVESREPPELLEESARELGEEPVWAREVASSVAVAPLPPAWAGA